MITIAGGIILAIVILSVIDHAAAWVIERLP